MNELDKWEDDFQSMFDQAEIEDWGKSKFTLEFNKLILKHPRLKKKEN